MSVQVRFGLDAGDDLSSGELADRPPERRHPRRVEREQAYRLVPRGRGQQRRDRGERGERASSSAVPGDAEDRRRPPGSRPRRGGVSRRHGSGRGCRAPAPARPDRRRARLHDGPAVGSAQAIASIHVVTARSRAVRPGPALREVGVQDRHEVEPAPAEVPHVVGPAHEDLALLRQRGTSSGPSRFTGTVAARIAHSSTRSRPPRRRPKSCAPQCLQRPSASHTTHRTPPSSARSRPPQAAHAAGAPHDRQTAAMP